MFVRNPAEDLVNKWEVNGNVTWWGTKNISEDVEILVTSQWQP